MTMTQPWDVFLSPHTDDESLAMAGAITRAHLANHKTLVVLVTDNQPSERGRRLFPATENLDHWRRVEWMKAMSCLHVDELQNWEIPEVAMVSLADLSLEHIGRRIDAVAGERTVAGLHTVWGAEDTHAESGLHSQSHALTAAAAIRFGSAHPEIPVSLYGVYVYSKPEAERPHGVPLTAKEWSRKRDALACYKESPDTIGYGYRSVPELFDAADLDPHEYVIPVATPVLAGAGA